MIRYLIDSFLDTLSSLAAGLVVKAPLTLDSAASDEELGLSPCASTPRHQSDGRYLAWVLHCMPWSEPKLEPQLCMDAELCDHQFKNRKHVKIVAKHVLSIEDYGLTLDQLIGKFPAPDLVI